MTQVNTFDASLGEQTALTEVTAVVRRKMLGIRNRLERRASAQTDETTGHRSNPLSGYYEGAYERAKAGIPVTSLRQITGI